MKSTSRDMERLPSLLSTLTEITIRGRKVDIVRTDPSVWWIYVFLSLNNPEIDKILCEMEIKICSRDEVIFDHKRGGWLLSPELREGKDQKESHGAEQFYCGEHADKVGE